MKKFTFLIIFSLFVSFFYLTINNTYSLFTKKIDKTGSINTIKSEATFLEGRQFNAKIKSLAGNNDATYLTEDNFILNISRSDTLTINPTSDNIVSDSNSIMPIYAWFNNGTLYYYSEANTLYSHDTAYCMFCLFNNLESIDIEEINTSKTSNMQSIFNSSYKLQNLDLSNFDTSNVVNMQAMFMNNTMVKNLDLTNFNTSKTLNMHAMFNNCNNLEKLDISSFDMSKVTNTTQMLYDLANIKEIKTPNIYPSNTSVQLGLFKTMYDENMVGYTTLGKSTTPTSPTQTWLKEGYTVSFDANGGSVATASKVVRKDGTYGTLPEPTRTGYTFKGWNGKNLLNYNNLSSYAGSVDIVVDNNGNITDNTNTTDSRTWSYQQSNWKVSLDAGTYTLSLLFDTQADNNNSGLCVYKDDETLLINSGYKGIKLKDSYATTFIINEPTNIGIMVKAYQGVYKIQLEKNSESTEWEPYYITSDTEVVQEQNHTLKAIYTPNTYTVSFDVNGGKHPSNSILFSFDASTNTISGTVNEGTWGDDYLYLSGKNSSFVNLGEINNDYMTMNVDFSLTDYTSSPTIMSNMEGGGLGVFINSNNNIVGQVYINGSYRSITTNYAIELGKRYNTTLSYDGKVQKFYVNGELIGTINIEGVIGQTTKSTVMVLGGNPNGSSITGNSLRGKIYKASLYGCNRYTKDVTYNSTYGTLPTPTKEGYSFVGWNTSEDGTGTTITSSSNVTITSNQILYAKWSDATNPMLSLSKETYWEQDLSTWTLHDSTVDSNGILTLNSDEALAISDFIPVNGEFYYNVFDAYTETIAPYYNSKGGVNWVVYYYDENKQETTTAEDNISDVHGYAMDLNTWYNEIYWLNSKYNLDLWKNRNRYASNIKYIKIKYRTTTDVSKSPTKIRNLKVYGQMPNDFYLINIDSSDNVGVVQTKYAKGNYNVSYFENNGTVVNGNQIRVTENGIYTVFVKDSSGNTNVETIEITNININVTLDANGGSVSSSPQQVVYNSTYGNLPTPTRVGYTFKGWVDTLESNLPSNYVKLDYIESGIFRYINTGVKATNKTVVEAKLYTEDTGNKNWFGGSGTTEHNYVLNSWNINALEYNYGTTPGWGWPKPSTSYDVVGSDFIVRYGDGSLYVNDEKIATLPIDSFTDTNDMYIFVRNQNVAKSSSYITGRVYYFKVYENNVLIRDYIPVLNKTTHTLGLYDLVNNVFYSNSGTGEFGANYVTSSTVVNKYDDHTLYAVWETNTYTVSYDKGNLLYGLELNQSLVENANMDYSITNGVIEVTSKVDDGCGYTTGRFNLEANKTYIFNASTDGVWGGGNTDTVDAFLMLDGTYPGTYYHMNSNIDYEFTPSVSGEYWLRLDVNQANKTYHFWDISITEKDMDTKTVTYDSTYGTLPELEKEGYSFDGWYLESNYQTQVTSSSTVLTASNHTIYAKWTKLTKYSITNIVQNGSFENGTTNWNLYNSTYSDIVLEDTNHVMVMKSTNDEDYTGGATQTISTPIADHKYYGRLKLKTSSDYTAGDSRFEIWTADATNARYVYFYKKDIKTSTWRNVSNIVTVVDSQYLTNRTWIIRNFSRKSNVDIYVDDVIIIDLTATFGSGNEPSKAWCDENINFFEGTTYIYK